MDLSAITRFAVDGMLNSLLTGIAIALLAWAAARLFQRHGSGTRFAVWLLALAAVVLLPLAGRLANHPMPRLAPASAFTLPESFARYLFVAWTIGASLGLAHVALGFFRLRGLRRACVPVDLNQLDPILRDTIDDAQTHRRVSLCSSDAIRVPAAIGYFRPIVVVPSWALAEIPPAELHAILLHELAHLRRWDDWTNLAQKVAKAVFFFHPAVWFIEGRLTLEREMACDDAVLAANFNARAYAESLVGLAEKSFLRRSIQLAQAAVGHVQQLKFRLAEILRHDRGQQGTGRLRKPAIALMSVAGMMLVYGAAHTPRLIAFSSDAAQIASTSPVVHADAVPTDLKPVNLNFTDHLQPSSPPLRKVEPAHLRVAHRSDPQQRMLLAVQRAEARTMDGNAPPPIVLLSNFPLESAPAPVLVVFQGEQFGDNGPIFWRVTVVHLTPAQQRAITGGVSKQI